MCKNPICNDYIRLKTCVDLYGPVPKDMFYCMICEEGQELSSEALATTYIGPYGVCKHCYEQQYEAMLKDLEYGY